MYTHVLGSTQLSDRELQNCPIKPGSYIYSQDQSGRGQWKFTCNVPAYQGSQVDTRVKYLGMYGIHGWCMYDSTSLHWCLGIIVMGRENK